MPSTSTVLNRDARTDNWIYEVDPKYAARVGRTRTAQVNREDLVLGHLKLWAYLVIEANDS